MEVLSPLGHGFSVPATPAITHVINSTRKFIVLKFTHNVGRFKNGTFSKGSVPPLQLKRRKQIVGRASYKIGTAVLSAGTLTHHFCFRSLTDLERPLKTSCWLFGRSKKTGSPICLGGYMIIIFGVTFAFFGGVMIPSNYIYSVSDTCRGTLQLDGGRIRDLDKTDL